MRHAETEWNEQGRFMSRTDLPLSASAREGLPLSFEAVRRLAPERVLCSPALRCRQTAEAVLPASGAAALEVVEDLSELDFGLLEGMTPDEIASCDLSGDFAEWRDISGSSSGPPGGESWACLDTRVERLLARFEQDAGSTLVVSHGYLIRAVLVRAVAGLPARSLRSLVLDNGHMSSMVFSKGRWRLLFHNSIQPPLGALPVQR